MATERTVQEAINDEAASMLEGWAYDGFKKDSVEDLSSSGDGTEALGMHSAFPALADEYIDQFGLRDFTTLIEHHSSIQVALEVAAATMIGTYAEGVARELAGQLLEALDEVELRTDVLSARLERSNSFGWAVHESETDEDLGSLSACCMHYRNVEGSDYDVYQITTDFGTYYIVASIEQEESEESSASSQEA